MFRFNHTAVTDVGLQRKNNEDAFFASSKRGLWVVADGMGGHAAGEVASAIVIDTIEREVVGGHTLCHAIQRSHHDILNAANSGIGGIGMGSTVVALSSKGQHFQICWVGDSRAYLLAPTVEDTKRFELRQLTTDHSYVQMLYQSGAITEDELSTHPEKNIITQCLGSVELSEVTVEQIDGEWIPNSKILLCSDGLSDVVSDNDIQAILTQNTSLSIISQKLINAALDAGGKDNITLTLVNAPNPAQRMIQSVTNRLFPH